MSSQSENAYRQIKDMIFKMEYLPGEKLSELQLSSKLSISRTPIHAAITRLASEGLVIIADNRSSVVRKFSDVEVQEIGAIRLAQDILSAQLASYYGSAADFDYLAKLARDCECSASQGDVYGRIEADRDFHLEIARMSANGHLYQQQVALYQKINLIQISKYTDIESSLVQIQHHMPLIRAMKAGELEIMVKIISEHISEFYDIDPYLLKCFGMKG